MLGQQGRVSTQALADTLGVAPASVTGMLRKLAAEGHGAYLEPDEILDIARRGAELGCHGTQPPCAV